MEGSPRLRGMVFAGLALFLVGLLAGVAFASNTHSIGHIYHGLGDGQDGDNYLHPFTDVSDNHNVSSLYVNLFRDASVIHLFGDSCSSCSHIHRNWDATGHPDRCYYSSHDTGGSGDHFLNYHNHYHHDGFIDC